MACSVDRPPHAKSLLYFLRKEYSVMVSTCRKPNGGESNFKFARSLSQHCHSPGGRLIHVRFGSKADICAAKGHVRFTPSSDRESVPWSCPLYPQKRTHALQQRMSA